MDSEEKEKKILHSEWMITEPIELDDICILESTGQEFLCSKIIPHEQFEYLYFGSFDFKDTLFVVQYKINDANYARVLAEKSYQEFAFNLYKSEMKK